MADTKWTGKDTKDLKDFGIQIITIGHLDANQAKRLSELISNACEQIKQLKGDKDHPEYYCHICGGKNITWYADNELWNQVVVDIGIICCPLCFVKLAEQKGIKPTAWRLSRECDEPEVDKLRLEIVGQIERIKELEAARG